MADTLEGLRAIRSSFEVGTNDLLLDNRKAWQGFSIGDSPGSTSECVQVIRCGYQRC